MKIYSMTATFGKLEHETLVLKPGLNVIQAPNEWGKSTWCAFLTAMLYGLDTRAKSTKTALADKERFAPWSGSPMAGRIDLCWNGRDITIERHTKRRVPLGEFRAYETETGIEIPELNAANCGQQLLGVERSVFMRAGFIRFSDLPVTQDDALRRRLNALVTTGDESATADQLAKGLRDLKNRCRYNKSGLLPQAEAERDTLESKLREQENYEKQLAASTARLEEVVQLTQALTDHQAALRYEDAKADARRVAAAEEAFEKAEANYVRMKEQCDALPSAAQAQQAANALQQLHKRAMALDVEQQMLPQPPVKPEYTDAREAENAQQQAEKHAAWLQALYKDRTAARRLRYAAIGMLIAAVPVAALIWGITQKWHFAAVAAVPLLAGLILWFVSRAITREISGHLRYLEGRYGTLDADAWIRKGKENVAEQSAYEKAQAEYEARMAEFQAKREILAEDIQSLTQGLPIADCLRQWEQISEKWEALEDARQTLDNAGKYARTVAAMARTAPKPERDDHLSYSEEETARYLAKARVEQQELQNRLGQYQGRIEALGQKQVLRKQLQRVNEKIGRLEEVYDALIIAQQTLSEAASELQRRFAPRIAKRAQELMTAFTGGRYDRLSLGEDFSLRTGAEQEDVLHEALWRSDGTVDQLYLSLRLAVAEELTPEAPLILDDALVRFDDSRLCAALNVLRTAAAQRQVILFTCHDRERKLLDTTEE